ncbi:fimbrillin family protein [Bacteroides sp. 519]|uniref:fimbrillin family protein n=1 Tax=Bacteroides sp. 519 TaxID=2302937 RepID=UPI0013D37736|nr:fimbrillin family protein [Bacteroides sp. 519]NDV60573.1 hypothetical protein [Bacteroides sp. 519]
MIQSKYLSGLLVCAAFLGSCTNEMSDETVIDPEAIKLEIGVIGSQEVTTRGQASTDEGITPEAYHNYTGTFQLLMVEVAGSPTAFYDDPVIVATGGAISKVNGTATTSYTKRWPSNDGQLYFHAYAPASGTGAFTKPAFSAAANYTLDNPYTIQSAYTNQPDLLFANIGTHKRSDNSGTVAINFDHLLTRITFQIRREATGFIGSDEVWIKEVAIKDVYDRGTPTMSTSGFSWGTKSKSGATPTFSMTFSTPLQAPSIDFTETSFESAFLPNLPTTSTPTNNYSMFMLPHDKVGTGAGKFENAKLYLKFRVAAAHDTAGVDDTEVEFDLKDYEDWVAGYWINYQITIKPGYITINPIKVKGWNKINVPITVN